MKPLRIIVWIAVAILGASALAVLAISRGEDHPSVLWFVVAAVCVYSLGYRFYSRFIAERVLELDDSHITPAIRLSNGRIAPRIDVQQAQIISSLPVLCQLAAQIARRAGDQDGFSLSHGF